MALVPLSTNVEAEASALVEHRPRSSKHRSGSRRHRSDRDGTSVQTFSSGPSDGSAPVVNAIRIDVHNSSREQQQSSAGDPDQIVSSIVGQCYNCNKRIYCKHLPNSDQARLEYTCCSTYCRKVVIHASCQNSMLDETGQRELAVFCSHCKRTLHITKVRRAFSDILFQCLGCQCCYEGFRPVLTQLFYCLLTCVFGSPVLGMPGKLFHYYLLDGTRPCPLLKYNFNLDVMRPVHEQKLMIGPQHFSGFFTMDGTHLMYGVAFTITCFMLFWILLMVAKPFVSGYRWIAFKPRATSRA